MSDQEKTLPLHIEHLRVLASAGSGKTYLMALKVLGLVSSGVNPSSILVSTFTRKAAGELRERVMGFAAAAVVSDAERESFVESGLVGFDEAAARRTLSTLVDAMDRLCITTLDGWFAAVTQACPSETGQSIGSSVLEAEAERLLTREAIERAIDADSSGRTVRLLNVLSSGELRSGLIGTIERQVIASLKDWRSAATSDMDQECVRGDGIPSSWRWDDELSKLPAVDREEFEGLIHQVIEWNEVDTKSSPWKSMVKHLPKEGLPRKNEWSAFLGSSFAKNIGSGVIKFSSRTDFSEAQLKVTRQLIAMAKGFMGRQAIESTHAAAAVLAIIDRERNTLLRESGVTDFDGVTRAVGDALRAENGLDLLWRLDERIEHVLLDEFQDTSVAQWRALHPLVAEVCASAGRHLLVVGDLKQSIYGWRAGDPQLLDNLPSIIAMSGVDVVETDSIARNFRSSPAVLRAVDRVMGTLTSNTVIMRCDGAVQLAAQAWSEKYRPHTAAKLMSGEVVVHVVPHASSSGGGTPEWCTKAVDVIRELRERSPTASIGVIARRNKSVDQVVHALRKKGIPSSALAGGNLLTSPAASCVVDLLRFACVPTDTAAFFHVVKSPLSVLVGFDQLNGEKDDHANASLSVRRLIDSHGLSETISGWMNSLEKKSLLSKGDRTRLRQLITLADAAELKGPVCLPSFVREMECKQVQDASGHSVDVLNIHKAKGLEWDAVVLIDQSHHFQDKSTLRVSRSASGTGPERVIWGVPKGAVSACFQKTISASHQFVANEAMCCLYVALTRAKRALHIVLDGISAKSEDPMTTGGVIARGFDIKLNDPKSHRVESEGAWPDEHSTNGASVEREVVPMPSSAPLPLRVVKKAKSASALGHEAPATRTQSSGVEQRDALDYGTVMHKVAESIECARKWNPSTASLIEMCQAELPLQNRLWIERTVLKSVEQLRAVGLVGALTSPSADGLLGKVCRECAFVEMTDDGLREGSIDRLTAVGTEGQWKSAVVLDFKSDRFSEGWTEADLVAKAEGHRSQLGVYREVAAKWLKLDVSKVEIRLAFTQVGRLVTLK
ncbi:MAG: UvrD-helicase domain-containing protein [Planctomycetota bacterium]|nr:UvrD-helicase domain-containing protein [Planctomycetota bacterium]